MAAQTVLEEIIENAQRSSVGINKGNAVIAFRIALGLLGRSLTRQPALAPLCGIFEELLKPAANQPPDHAQLVLARIKKLKAKHATASDIEQRKIKEQIDQLFELLVEEE